MSSPLPSSSTSVPLPACPACGSYPHAGGLGACPYVIEVEYDSYGRVRRFVKRAEANWFSPPMPRLEDGVGNLLATADETAQPFATGTGPDS